MTKPVTRQMIIDCLLYRLGMPSCPICKELIRPTQEIDFDHIHADVFDGPHAYENLRPLHRACHHQKTAQDVKANAKVKRILKKRKGITKKGRPWPKRKFAARRAKPRST